MQRGLCGALPCGRNRGDSFYSGTLRLGAFRPHTSSSASPVMKAGGLLMYCLDSLGRFELLV
jgi:hypothetical protein